MITIWKYPIPIQDDFAIEMPVNSKILSFQVQKGNPMIWCQVDTDLELAKRVFRLCKTGHKIWFEHWNFIGTIQLDLVYHLYEQRYYE